MLSISERLRAVASLVPQSRTVADIGTDHGYLPSYLVLSGRCESAIASDIAEGPCKAAAETRIKYGLQGVMEIRKASGLHGLAVGEADSAVIAGMGGTTILNILKDSYELAQTIKTFVLQPMNAEGILRRWLTENRFCICEETLCKEKEHIYIVMLVRPAENMQALSLLEQEIGPCIIDRKPELLTEYLKGKIENIRHILRQMENSGNARSSNKFENLKLLLAQIEDFQYNYK